MKKIAVIGSNSFSGSDFIDLLLEGNGYEVIGISRSPEKSALFLPYKRKSSPRFRFYAIDLNRRMPDLLGLLDEEKPFAVANFATQSEVAPSWEHPEDWFRTNGVAFARLLNHLRKKDYLKKYLHISTPEVYGSSQGSVTEANPMNPSTPYAVTRAAQDMFLEILRRQFGFPFVSVRSANIFGARQQLWKIIPRSAVYVKMKKKIELHGGGKASRSFIHIRDVSRGELAALEKGKPGGIYNLATGKNHTVREVVEKVCEVMKADFKSAVVLAQDRPGQDAAYVLDAGRARRELGWKPEVSLEEGIREVADWVEAHWEEIKEQPLEYVHKP